MRISEYFHIQKFSKELLDLVHIFCQTPVLGLGLGVDFTFALDNNNNNNNNDNYKNPHLNFLERNSTWYTISSNIHLMKVPFEWLKK